MNKSVTKAEKVKEPLFHISRRPAMPLAQSILIRAIAIAAAFLVAGIFSMLVLKTSPVKIFSSMLTGSFGSSRKILKLLKSIAVLLMISLAVTPAFRMRFWNIGAEGQVLIGALASTACIVNFGGKLSEPLLLLIMLAAGVLAGAVWGLIPAIFKAFWNTNETLFTLMMNYVANYLVAYYLIIWTPNGSSSLGRLSYGILPKLGHEYTLILIISMVLTAVMYIYLYYSKHGYEISVVGESEKTAKYIGINVRKVIIRTMLFSGAVCGLVGFLIVSGLDNTITTETVGGQGFTAIMVSWLGKFNPLIMILTSFLLIFLNQGSAQISQDFDISDAFPDVIVGIILFFVIGCEFFINYKINFIKKNKEVK